MANKKFVVKLSSEERAQLTGLISKGKTAARTALKARILLKADERTRYARVCCCARGGLSWRGNHLKLNR